MKIYAIIETGGEQMQVEPGRFYNVGNLISSLYQSKPLIGYDKIQRFVLYRILMIRHPSKTILGKPWIKYASIKGRLLQFYRDQKIIVYKMNAKKKTRKKVGYRHLLVRFVVDSIYVKDKEFTMYQKVDSREAYI
jgi:large subunit ribosomal protein L21